MPTKIYAVEDVQLAILKTYPPTLRIVSTGLVNSGGWSDGKLIPYVYVMPPPDGIYDFDFVATPPCGIAIQVILPITASHHWRAYPQDLKGVRIHASAGSLEARLDGASSITLKALPADEDLKIPLFLTGIVVDEGIGFCRDGATHRLLYLGDSGLPSAMRLKANNPEAEAELQRVSGTRQRVTVAGYLKRGIEPGCDYLNTYHVAAEIQPEAFASR